MRLSYASLSHVIYSYCPGGRQLRTSRYMGYPVHHDMCAHASGLVDTRCLVLKRLPGLVFTVSRFRRHHVPRPRYLGSLDSY